MGPTLESLLEAVGPAVLYKARRSQMEWVRLGRGQRRFLFLVWSTEPYSDPDGHLVSVLYPNLIPFDRLPFYPSVTPLNRRCRLFCACPFFSYGGPKYWSTLDLYRLPEGKYREERFPSVRDPEGQHRVCKHVVRVGWDLGEWSFPRLLADAREPRTAMHAEMQWQRLRPVVAGYLRERGCADPKAELAGVLPEQAELLMERWGLLC